MKIKRVYLCVSTEAWGVFFSLLQKAARIGEGLNVLHRPISVDQGFEDALHPESLWPIRGKYVVRGRAKRWPESPKYSRVTPANPRQCLFEGRTFNPFVVRSTPARPTIHKKPL